MPVIFLWLTAKVVREDSLYLQKTLNTLTIPKTLWEFILLSAQRREAQPKPALPQKCRWRVFYWFYCICIMMAETYSKKLIVKKQSNLQYTTASLVIGCDLSFNSTPAHFINGYIVS